MRILIAGFSTRACAESAVAGGLHVVTVDYFGDLDQCLLAPGVSLRERGQEYSAEAIRDAAAGLEADAVAYCGGLENHPEVVAALATGRRLLGNAPETLRRVRDPFQVQAFLARRGFQVPATLDRHDPPPASGEWLVKPVRGGGGRGVRPWDGSRPPGPGQLLQERIAGLPASAVFVADGRRAVRLGWSEQTPGPRGFLYGGNLLPLAAPEAAAREVDALIQALTEEYGLRGLNGIDFILRETRPLFLEVNPRYCASMELVDRSAGLSAFALHVEACQGRLPEAPPPTPAEVWGKRIVYVSGASGAPGGLRVPDTRAWIPRGVRDVPHPGADVGRGEPLCTVLARAPTRESCLALLAAEEAGVLEECRAGDEA